MEGQMHHEGQQDFNPAEMMGEVGQNKSEAKKSPEQLQAQRMEVWQKFGEVEEQAAALEKQAEEIDRKMETMFEGGIKDTIDQRLIESFDNKRLELRTTVESLAATMKTLREEADDMRNILNSIKDNPAN